MKNLIYLLFIVLTTTAFSQLKIIHPNGGEKLRVGSEALISWRDSIYDDEMARVEFSSNNGNDWTTLHSYRPDYNYKWTVPNIISENCLIKVTQTTNINYLPPVVWSKSYGGNINSMALTADGGYIAVGGRDMKGEVPERPIESWYYDGWIFKVDSVGKVEWSKNFGEEGSNAFYSVIQTMDGGYVAVGGYQLIPYLSNSRIFWAIKIDSIGEKVWERSFGADDNNIANKVIETKEGDLVLCGSDMGRESTGYSNIKVIKLNSKGHEVWSRDYGGSSSDVVHDILETDDKNLIIAGYTFSKDGDFSSNKGQFDGWVMKIGYYGEVIWSKLYGSDKNDRLNSISKTEDGGYIVAGSTVSWKVYNGGKDEYWILKLDKDGNVEWERRFGTKGNDEAMKAFETKDGNFIVAGYSDGEYYDNGRNYGLKDYWIIKFNKVGWIIWASNYGGKSNDVPFSIFELKNGQYVMGGRSGSKSYDIDTTDWQGNFWVMKIDDNSFVEKIGISESVFSIIESQTRISNTNSDIRFTIHPNIVTSTASVTLELTENGKTTLELFDSQGRRIETLFSGYETIGMRELQIDVRQYPSGKYFLKLTTPTISKTEFLEVQR